MGIFNTLVENLEVFVAVISGVAVFISAFGCYKSFMLHYAHGVPNKLSKHPFASLLVMALPIVAGVAFLYLPLSMSRALLFAVFSMHMLFTMPALLPLLSELGRKEEKAEGANGKSKACLCFVRIILSLIGLIFLALIIIGFCLILTGTETDLVKFQLLLVSHLLLMLISYGIYFQIRKKEHTVAEFKGTYYVVIAESTGDGWLCAPFEKDAKPGSIKILYKEIVIKELMDARIHLVDSEGARALIDKVGNKKAFHYYI